MSKTTEGIRAKLYRCKECGFERQIETNHYGECYSFGSYGRCPKMHVEPPNPRRPQDVTYRVTTWVCAEPAPEGMGTPVPWEMATIHVRKVRRES